MWQPACDWQTGARRICGQATSQPCRRHEEPVRVQRAPGPEPAPYSIRVCPDIRGGVGGAVLDPSTGPRIGSAFVPRGTPSGERGSIRQVAPGQGLTLQVSQARNTGKSQKVSRLSPERTSGWKARNALIGPLRPDRLQLLSSHVAVTWQDAGVASTSATARRSERAAAAPACDSSERSPCTSP